jgi:hypothetical protein
LGYSILAVLIKANKYDQYPVDRLQRAILATEDDMGYLLAGFTANEDKPLADYVADGVSIGHLSPVSPLSHWVFA